VSGSPRKQLDLAVVAAHDWLDQVAADMPEFDQLCEAIGKRFAAFSFIAGVRITSIAYDEDAPDRTMVDFAVDEGSVVEQLALPEFRQRMCAALLAPHVDVAELGDEPTADDLRAFLGARYLLLAPVFGLRLVHVLVGGDGPPLVKVDLGARTEDVPLATLRQLLDDAIRSELARVRPPPPVAIDFGKVPLAEAANEVGDHDKTISLLGSWPGPLSTFMRTARGQALGPRERATLTRALELLGVAYIGKGQIDWAEDVLRLGINVGQETDAAGSLFSTLGLARMTAGRHGEAIGMLRRALTLGGRPAEILPRLAQCFHARQRYVAAILCLDDAVAAGANPDRYRELRKDLLEVLGTAYEEMRAVVPATSPGRE
jgi:tetratricopeptide (TPR) repeat protein